MTASPVSVVAGGQIDASPTFVDVAALLAGGLPEPPMPTRCRRVDGVGLFYEGQVNVLFGDPESGKTWLVYTAAVEALADGLRVVILDADHNGAQQVIHRLLALGAAADVLSDLNRFRLAEPDDRASLRSAVRESAAWGPRVAVVDSIGEVLPILGLSSNSPDDYTTAHREVLRPLAVCGAAVIAIDHLPKSAENRQAGPTGTVAKGRAVGGASLRVTVREPFVPGRGGAAVVTIKKDRPGGLRSASPGARPESPAGVFVMTVLDGRLDCRVDVPEESDALSAAQVSGQPYVVTDADIAAVEALAPDQQTHRGVKKALGVGADKATQMLRAHRDRSSLPNPGVQEQGAEQMVLAPALRERSSGAATDLAPMAADATDGES